MGSKINCICNVLEEIRDFRSILEFERFQEYIKGLVNNGDLTEISVQKKGAEFDEQWYKCSICRQVWKLAHPDFPFKGIWERKMENN